MASRQMSLAEKTQRESMQLGREQISSSEKRAKIAASGRSTGGVTKAAPRKPSIPKEFQKPLNPYEMRPIQKFY